MKHTFFILSLVCLFSCVPKPPIPPIPPSPDADAGIDGGKDDRAGYTCYNLCKHLQALHCQAAQPTAGGTSCVDVCNNVQTSGVISWDLVCRIKAKTCSAVDLCK